jgi:hypothetical protein
MTAVTNLLVVCRDAPDWLYFAGGTTIGSVFITGDIKLTDASLGHEYVHLFEPGYTDVSVGLYLELRQVQWLALRCLNCLEIQMVTTFSR